MRLSAHVHTMSTVNVAMPPPRYAVGLMGGTAAGAAKASAARREQAAARRAIREQSRNSLETVSKSLPVVGESMGLMDTATLHSQTVGPLVPLAGQVVADVLNGKGKASPAVRANTALEVLRQAQKPTAAPGGMPAGTVAALQALGQALAARIAPAAPVERPVRGEVVSDQ